jgi:hypothetical protein
MISPQFKKLHQKFGDSSFTQLHQSLNIHDKIAAFIRKERILQYPDGAALQGMIYLFEFHMVSISKYYKVFFENISLTDYEDQMSNGYDISTNLMTKTI